MHRVLAGPRFLIDARLAAHHPVFRVVDAAVKDLAGAGGDVAVGLEMLRHADEAGIGVAEIGAIVEDAGRIGVLAGQQAGARRVAERELAIGPLEADAAFGEGVEIRRVDDLVAVAAELGPQIVEGDQEDVEPRGVGGDCRKGAEDASG